jgi:23S rRNA (adenine2503-C2)-methyltransferase
MAPCYDTGMAPGSLYDLDRRALEGALGDLGYPRYRADQVWHWLYRRLVTGFDEMRNLPRDLQVALASRWHLAPLREAANTTSGEGLAEKALFGLVDGQYVETVLMHYLDPADDDADEPGGHGDGVAAPGGSPTPDVLAATGRADEKVRHTVCVSTQVGCAMGCVFCATGQMGLVRNLSAGECVAQVVVMARRLRDAGERLTSVVFMGMGEPLANWSGTWGAVETLTDPDGLGLSPRRLTISTVGIVPGIRRLARAEKPVRLAVSLHAPDDALRERLVGVNRVYPIAEVLAACREYQAAGGRRITIEYVLIDGVNDRPEQASRLSERLGGLNAHVNLIPLNPTDGVALRPSTPAALARFRETLTRSGVPTTARLRRGIAIAAGCGQLRTRVTTGRVGRQVAVSAPNVRKVHD